MTRSTMNENIVLVGAGSAMFTRGLIADMLRQGWEGAVTLVDVDPLALRVAEALARKMILASGSPLRVRACADRREAFRDATVIICTIGVGGRRAWEQDVFIPRRHGIFQPVGDSVMPGGTSRALRMIPPMVDIARDMMTLAPRSLFFNYGNPMSAVCRAVHKATGAPLTGLCHGVIHVAAHLAKHLGTELDRLAYAAAGMNHLTWFTDVRVGGQDAMPRLVAMAAERRRVRLDAGRLGGAFAEAGSTQRAAAPDDDPFTWELVECFHAFPAVLDRHVTEFFPHLFSREHSYYGKTLGVDAYRFEDCIAWGDRIFEDMKAMALSADPLPPDYFDRLGGEHEQVTDIIASIRRDEGRVFSANLPNRGQVPNLPADAIVESPAIADASGLHPVLQRPLPPGIAGTLATRFQWVDTVVDAALEGSRRTFIQALLIDGSVTSIDAAERLADDLIAAHSGCLPAFHR